MKINNRMVEYAAAIIFLLACLLVWFSPNQHQSDKQTQPSGFKVSTATTNEGITLGCQIRKLSLEITLFISKY